jgi:hypothetical protein
VLQSIRVFATELDVEQDRTPQAGAADVDLSDICLVPELAVTCGASMHGTLWPSSVTLSIFLEFCERQRLNRAESVDAVASPALLHGATILDRSDVMDAHWWTAAESRLRSHDCGVSLELTGARVLELGAGTGVCGLVCRRFTPAAHVTVTDVGAALALIERNRVRLGVSNDGLSIAELCWGEFGERFAREHVDVLMASDIIYETKCHQALLDTLLHFWQLNPRLVVILAHRRRYAHEDQFFASLAQAGFKKRDILRSVTTPQQRRIYDLDSEYYLYQVWRDEQPQQSETNV